MIDAEAWQAAKPRAQTRLPLQCNICKHVASVTINNLDKQRTFLCACSMRWKWNTESKMHELLSLMKSRFVVPYGKLKDALRDKEKWYTFGARSDTYLELQCTKCDTPFDTTTLASFVRNGRKGCGCLAKTEAYMCTLIEAVCAAHTDITVKRRVAVGPSAKGWKLIADCAIFKNERLIAAFECDGTQHFVNSFHSPRQTFQERLDRDLRKEKLVVAAGAVMVRMYQPDLWGSRGIPLQIAAEAFLKSILSAILNSTVAPSVVCQPNADMYTHGEYARMRDV